MAIQLNKVLIVGNLTRDPESRAAGGSSVCNFSIASNRTYNKNGDRQEEVTFLDVEAWGKTGELVGQYCTKGDTVLVEGELKQDRWEGKDGNTHSKIRLRAVRVQFMSKPKSDRQSNPTQEMEVPQQSSNVDVDCPPF